MTDIKSVITKGESASQDMATCMDKFARSFEASQRAALGTRCIAVIACIHYDA